jgi:four helix bundle protein
MLRIYPVVLTLLGELQSVVASIDRKDRDLARQLRRCSASIALNIAEGTYSRGQNRQARYHTALGSARETLACLEVAQHSRYVTAPSSMHASLNHIIGTLVRLVS